MRCFNVKDNFQRLDLLVEKVLRQKKDVVQVVTTKTIRPLLRNEDYGQDGGMEWVAR
jgi:hypothetical protein